MACAAADFVRDGVRFDVIVASWTLRHTADPLGLVEQLSNLLHGGGMLLCNEVWFHFKGGMERWDDVPALRAAIDVLSGGETGLTLELCIEGEARDTEQAGDSGGYCTALRGIRTSTEPVRFATVSFTGEVSGPVSTDPHLTANVSMSGGASWEVARYDLDT